MTAGCAAVAVGLVAGGGTYGAVKYDQNEVSRDYQAPVEDVWGATVAELKASGHVIETTIEVGSQGAEIDVDEVWAKVERADARTRVRVRVGTFETMAHKRKALELLDGIGQRLGQPPAAQAVAAHAPAK